MKPFLRELSRKGQMEMVGLVIIVILITLGMLFLVTFALGESPQKKIFTRKGLAYSSMSAIMKTTVDSAEQCNPRYVGEVHYQIGKDILEDCAMNVDTLPGGSSERLCGGQHSCVFLQGKIKELLNVTLGEWGKRYEFNSRLIQSASVDPIVLISINSTRGGCQGVKERDSSGLFPINTEGGLIENVLYLCD